MKKITGLMGVLLLGGCVAGGDGIARTDGIVKTVVENQCRTELNKRNEWKLAALVMTAQQQREWENKICGCASEEVLNQVTTEELIKIVNPNTRAQIAASVTAKTVTACVKRLMRE
ncbi:hypothetical protein [Neisseria dumasiana]|uniref:hypothetical protein n=1 Tax=Neisseria dumasiana TaxID=1931275 RepID=UPI000A18B253|nr:hypothetical protein [Neisseria dumasiana]OSI15584.1 hypothetical protein BV914_06445 [Neisseria dumasiana]